MITDSFDPITEEIVKASGIPAYAGGPGNSAAAGPFPETVIVTFSPKVERLVYEKYGGQEIGHLYSGMTVPIYRITNPECGTGSRTADEPADDDAANATTNAAGDDAGRQVAVFRSGIGAPVAAAMVEELIARGVRNIIVFGSCGVLDEQLATGHYIVPTEAYRDEGTSYHYAAPADYIRIRNADRVAEVLFDRNIPFVKSRIWTTDGFYRETRRNAAARLADGCIAVDMECSALQAVCDLRGCELYQFVYAEDSLDGETWQPRNMGKVTPGEMEFHFRAALAVAAALR